MKLLAYSDVHCDLGACAKIVAAAGDADLVIGAGDFAQRREGLAETMAKLEPIAHKSIIVPGNSETVEDLRNTTSATVLHGEMVTREGLQIVGIGCAIPPLPPLPWGSLDLTEQDAAALLAAFDQCDLFISHSPPFGFADVFGAETADFLGVPKGEHTGSISVRNWIETVKPRLGLFGHIHDGWGERGQIGACTVANLGPTVNWFEI